MPLDLVVLIIWKKPAELWYETGIKIYELSYALGLYEILR
jgi:hypothetical protein